MTFDPSLASGPSRASKLSLPAVSAAASAPPSLLARIGSPSVPTPQDGDTSRDAFDSNNLLSRIGSPSIQEAVVGPGNLLSRIGSPSVSLAQHGESSSSTVTLNKDDVEDRHRPRQLYLDPQPRPRSPTQPAPPLAQQLPQRPPTPPMPPRLSPPLTRALSRSSQSLPTPPAGGEPLAKQIPRASITTSTSTFISSPFDSSLRSRPAGRQYEDHRQESQRERPNYDNQRLPPRQSHVRERDIDHSGSRSRSRSPLASLPTDHPSRRDCRPSHSPSPARRRSPSPLAPAHQGPGPRFPQSNEQYLSSRPNTPPTPGVDSSTSNNLLTANQIQTQAFNQSRNQGQNRSGHLPNVSQTPLTVSQPSQTSRPSHPTGATTGPPSTSRPPSRQTQLQPSPQPSPTSQSNQSNQSASARLPTEVRPVPVAVPLTGRGTPHPRLTPASGPSAAQARPPPNLSSRLSQPAQQAALPLPQPPLMQVQSQPGPPPSATQTVRPSQTLQQQPQPLLQLQSQTQPQARSQSQSQQRIQPSSQRPAQDFPAPKTSQASQATRLAPLPSSPPPPVAPLPGQSKGNTSSTVNTRQRANQGVKIPPLTRTQTGTATGTGTDQLDVRKREAVASAGSGAGADSSKGTSQSQNQSQVKSEDKKDDNNKGQKKKKTKGKGKATQIDAKVANVEMEKGIDQVKSENQGHGQMSKCKTAATIEEKEEIDAKLTIERGEHGEKDEVDQRDGRAQEREEKAKVTSKTEAETFPSSQGSSHHSLPAVDSLPSPFYPARPERPKLGQSIQGSHLGHPSPSLQPSDSPHLPSSLPFPQANTLGPVSTPDALTTPGASNEQGLPVMNDGSVQFHSPSSHVPASSSSLSSSNASVRPFQLLQPLQPLQSITANSDRGAGPSTEHEQTILSLSGQPAHVPSIRPDAHTSISSPLFLRMPPISSPSMSSCNPSSSFTDPGPTLASSSTTADQLSVPKREEEKDQIEVDRNDTQTGKIESADKGKGKERLGETQGAGLFTVAGAVPLSFWVYGGPRARTLEIVITVSPFPSLISLSIHVFLFPISFLFYP